MVIQRIQTLLLFAAAVLMVLLSVGVPIAEIDHSPEASTWIYVKDQPTLLILTAAITLLLLISIFLYKNLKLQMRITSVAIVLMFALLVIGGFIMTSRMPVGAEVLWITAFGLVVASIALTFFAYRRMKADHNLLRSYDRIR